MDENFSFWGWLYLENPKLDFSALFTDYLRTMDRLNLILAIFLWHQTAYAAASPAPPAYAENMTRDR